MQRAMLTTVLLMAMTPLCSAATKHPSSPAPAPDVQVLLNMAELKDGAEVSPDVSFVGQELFVRFVIKNGFPGRYVLTPSWIMHEEPALPLASLERIAVTGTATRPSLKGFPQECESPASSVQAALEVLDDESKIPGARSALLEKIKKEYEGGVQASVGGMLDWMKQEIARESALLTTMEADATVDQEELDDQRRLVAETPAPMEEDAKRAVAGSFDECVAKIDQEFDERTSFDSEVFTLREKQDFRLVIKRVNKSGKTVARTVSIPATSGGQWRVMYGFSFRLDRDKAYFSEAVEGQQNKFTVREKDQHSDLEFDPVLVYRFRSPDRNHGFIGGLGLDIKHPIVFGGYQWTFHDNVGVFGAVAIHERAVLDGKYKKGQQIGSSLENDQLTRKTYSPNIMFGISFRFDKNPFAGGDKAQDGKSSSKPGEGKSADKSK